MIQPQQLVNKDKGLGSLNWTWMQRKPPEISSEFALYCCSGKLKARSHDPFLRIRFLLVPKIGSCEHIENDHPIHGSVILKERMGIEHALLSSDTLLERWKALTNFAWYPCDRFGAKLKILCQFWKSGRVNTLQMTFRHSHHKNGTLKSDRLNACFQFLEPTIGSLKSDRVNGP